MNGVKWTPDAELATALDFGLNVKAVGVGERLQTHAMFLFDAPAAAKVARILTPIAKYRTCRDNVTVATASMEARGGNGYIEDWPNARLVRDAC